LTCEHNNLDIILYLSPFIYHLLHFKFSLFSHFIMNLPKSGDVPRQGGRDQGELQDLARHYESSFVKRTIGGTKKIKDSGT